MKTKFIYFLSLTISGMIISVFSGCGGGAKLDTFCDYDELFGLAMIKKIENGTAYLSFDIEEASGKKSHYADGITVPAQEGIKPGTYLSTLEVLKSGSCQKYKLTVIDNINATCRAK